MCMVGLVDLRACHSAKKFEQKNGNSLVKIVLSRRNSGLQQARSEWIRALYFPNITGTDIRSTVLKLVATLQSVVCGEVPLFCSNLNSNRSSNFTNLLIHSPSLHSIAKLCSFV
jgi:hypothetical protein